MPTENYVCIRDDQIHNHSRRIERLDTRVEYQVQHFDEMNAKIDNIDKKIDTLILEYNQLQIKSSADDKDLELRLTAIETSLEIQKRNNENQTADTNMKLAMISLAFVILTFIMNYIIPHIH